MIGMHDKKFSKVHILYNIFINNSLIIYLIKKSNLEKELQFIQNVCKKIKFTLRFYICSIYEIFIMYDDFL